MILCLDLRYLALLATGHLNLAFGGGVSRWVGLRVEEAAKETPSQNQSHHCTSYITFFQTNVKQKFIDRR